MPNSEDSEQKTRRLLIVLAKYPQPGMVKTRLAKSIGEEKATELYHAFLTDLTPRFAPKSSESSFDVRWVYTPDAPEFQSMINELYDGSGVEGVSFIGYSTPGLAKHQMEQLQWAKSSGYQQAVIITTDSPQLTRSAVGEAFNRLNNHDVVIGPTYDGGYYLLGVREHWNVLENVTMSTDHVAQDVIKNAESMGLSVNVLDRMMDVDTKDDLVAFSKLIQSDGAPCPHTISVLKTITFEK